MAEIVQRWRLVYRRGAGASEMAQRAELEAWESALAASGLPVAVSSRSSARPRVATPPPLPAGLTADRELLDIQLTERLPAATVRERLAAVLPPHHELIDAFDVWIGAPPLPAQVVATDYRVDVRTEQPARLGPAASALLGAPTLERTKRRGERELRFDLRPFLLAVSVEPSVDPGERATVRMRLVVDPEQGTARPEDVVGALADATGAPLEIISGARTRVWTADEILPVR